MGQKMNFKGSMRCLMGAYVGIDLHSSNNYLVIYNLKFERYILIDK